MSYLSIENDYVSTTPIIIEGSPSHFPMAQHVAIVLATFNGSKFIEEQIRSILSQSYSEWVLFIRDDGSSDDTVEKVLKLEREDHRIKLIQDDLGNQGAKGNFAILMNVALAEGADFVFFSDQDDIWYSEKLGAMLAGIRELQQKCGKRIPLLVFSDLTLVNESLQPISDSFVKFSRWSPTSADLGVLLCQNVVTGCACVINRALLELACPVPQNALMHDWWLALLASAVGKIGFIPRQLGMYRQHFGNVIGAVSFVGRLKEVLFSRLQWEIQMTVIRRSFAQAGMLEERIRSRNYQLSNKLKPITIYSQILNVARIKRARKLREQKIGKQTAVARFAFNLLITCMKKIDGNPVA